MKKINTFIASVALCGTVAAGMPGFGFIEQMHQNLPSLTQVQMAGSKIGKCAVELGSSAFKVIAYTYDHSDVTDKIFYGGRLASEVFLASQAIDYLATESNSNILAWSALALETVRIGKQLWTYSNWLYQHPTNSETKPTAE